MSWNGLFWLLFAASEAAVIAMLSSGFPETVSVLGGSILAMGALKLIEDWKGLKGSGTEVRVRRSLLNKLKAA